MTRGQVLPDVKVDRFNLVSENLVVIKIGMSLQRGQAMRNWVPISELVFSPAHLCGYVQQKLDQY